jgi:hypothetical protein
MTIIAQTILRSVAAASAMAMAVVAVPANSGDSEDISALLQTINRTKQNLVDQGMVISHITVDRITRNNDHTITRTMYANNQYTVAGVSGPGIQDLDMWVNDPNAQEVGSDVLLDNYPVVAIPNSQNGTYTMRMRYVTAQSGFNAEDERYFALIVAFRRNSTGK